MTWVTILVRATLGFWDGLELGMVWASDLVWTSLLAFSSSMPPFNHLLILFIVPKYTNLRSQILVNFEFYYYYFDR